MFLASLLGQRRLAAGTSSDLSLGGNFGEAPWEARSDGSSAVPTRRSMTFSGGGDPSGGSPLSRAPRRAGSSAVPWPASAGGRWPRRRRAHTTPAAAGATGGICPFNPVTTRWLNKVPPRGFCQGGDRWVWAAPGTGDGTRSLGGRDPGVGGGRCRLRWGTAETPVRERPRPPPWGASPQSPARPCRGRAPAAPAPHSFRTGRASPPLSWGSRRGMTPLPRRPRSPGRGPLRRWRSCASAPRAPSAGGGGAQRPALFSLRRKVTEGGGTVRRSADLKGCARRRGPAVRAEGRREVGVVLVPPREGRLLARSSRLPPLPPPPCPGSPRSWSRRWCGSLTRSATPTWTGSAPPWPAAAGSAWVSGGRGRAGRPSGLCSGPCSGCRGRRGSASPGLALPRVRGRAVGRPSAPTPEKGGQGARGVPGQPPHPGGTPGQSGPGCERDALLVPHAEASGAASGLVRGCVLMGKANSLICYRCCCLLDVSPGSLGTGTCCALLSAGVCSWGPACRDFLGPIAILKRLNVLRGCGKEGSLPS